MLATPVTVEKHALILQKLEIILHKKYRKLRLFPTVHRFQQQWSEAEISNEPDDACPVPNFAAKNSAFLSTVGGVLYDKPSIRVSPSFNHAFQNRGTRGTFK